MDPLQKIPGKPARFGVRQLAGLVDFLIIVRTANAIADPHR
jgi:hypothetical protein